MNSVANLSLATQSQAGTISFIDLNAQQRLIREAIETRLKRILDHGRYINGPEIAELEEELKRRTGAKCAVACGSGTAALIIPLLARGFGAGDAVFIPAFTYNATANAVLLTGATPVFVDIDPTTYNMDPEDLQRRIDATRQEGALTPKAIIPVDLFGSPADYPAIGKIARTEELFLLADGAQGFGGRLGNAWVGDLAPATSISFFPGKSLGAYGEGGAILGQHPDDAECWESIRWHGTDDQRKESIRVGFNGRMDSFQAAVLLEKLSLFDSELAARHRIADAYNARFGKLGKPQRHLNDAQSGYGYYALRVENRDQIVAKLNAMGVPTAIYYSTPLHRMPAFAALAPAGGLPATEKVAEEIFSLPIHPYLTPDQVDYICDAVETAVA